MYKLKKISFWLVLRLICFAIFTSISSLACSNNDTINSQDTATGTSIDSGVLENPSSKLDSISNASSCDKEKEEIKMILAEMKFKATEVRKAYGALRGDEIEWGKYIRNWNIEAKNFREQHKAKYFSCIHSFYIGETWIDLLQIGTSYAFDNKSGVKEFERKLNSDIDMTLQELRNFKSN